MSWYWQTLDPCVCEAKILLVPDGHSNRAPYEAANQVDVFILLARNADLMQLFDVIIASPLKTDFETTMIQILAMSRDAVSRTRGSPDEPEDQALERTTSETRLGIVLGLLEAWKISASRSNVRSGLEKSGVVPVNKNISLESKLIPKVTTENLYVRRKGRAISGGMLTDQAYEDVPRTAPSRIFPQIDPRIAEAQVQWHKLTRGHPNPSSGPCGIYLVELNGACRNRCNFAHSHPPAIFFATSIW
jgi:hypothetical protein